MFCRNSAVVGNFQGAGTRGCVAWGGFPRQLYLQSVLEKWRLVLRGVVGLSLGGVDAFVV